jgi:peptidoglycan/LPS O-acetylase OafA/YrhL
MSLVRALETGACGLKLNSVQYLRDTAVLLVAAYHAANNLGSVIPHFGFFEYGQYGVDLFFVISGFIMMITTASNPSPAFFFLKRFWRIAALDTSSWCANP